jgi:hypothetical protein
MINKSTTIFLQVGGIGTALAVAISWSVNK